MRFHIPCTFFSVSQHVKPCVKPPFHDIMHCITRRGEVQRQQNMFWYITMIPFKWGPISFPAWRINGVRWQLSVTRPITQQLLHSVTTQGNSFRGGRKVSHRAAGTLIWSLHGRFILKQHNAILWRGFKCFSKGDSSRLLWKRQRTLYYIKEA
jgi:hypothetical protein